MKVLKVVPLVLGFLLYANSACALTLPGAAAAAAATGAGLEAILQGVEQANSFLAWSRANNLTPEEVKQVQAAIDYMKEKGFVNEAKQAQTMLNNTKSTGWSLLGSTYVVKEGGSADMAETFGGPSNAVFNNGHTVLYRNFFNTSKHDGIVIDTPDKKTRDQALTLIHELEHKNTQSDVTDIHLINVLRGYDVEKGPLTKTAETLGPLGYTPDEIRTIRDSWNKGPYKPYVNLIDKQLPKIDPPKVDDASPPTTDEPGPDATRDRPRKHRSDATKSKGPRAIDDDEPTKTKAPPREKSDSGDQVDPDFKGPTADQIARAGKLGDQSQGGIPGTSQPTGQATGRTGQPQGGYQGGQEVPGASAPQQPGTDVQMPLCQMRDAAGNVVMRPCPQGATPPYDPRSDPRGGMNVPTPGSQQPGVGGTASGGNTPSKSGTPPTKVAKTPSTAQSPQGVRVNCYGACVQGCLANTGASGYFGGMCAPYGPCDKSRVNPDACSKYCAGYKQDTLVNADDGVIRVCGPSGAATKPPASSPAGATCGPATSCRCAGGAQGHIPCDKSKGACHCGAG